MKKGFTLVEMLAVFILLALIALIAVPTINKLREQYEEDTFIESIKGILQAAEAFHAENDYENYPKEGLLISDPRLNIKNANQFLHGYVIYNDQLGKFEVRLLTNGNFCARGSKDDLEITEGDCETNSECFVIEGSEIVKYDYSNSSCPADVKIPRILNGNIITSIGASAFEYPEEDLMCSTDNFESTNLKDASYTPAANEICIGKNAYYGYTEDNSLHFIVLPEKLRYIKSKAFSGTNLKMLDLSATPEFERFDNYALLGVKKFKKVNMATASMITSIGDFAFYKTALYDFNFRRLGYLTSIGKYAFSQTDLSTIELSSTRLKEIKDYAFYKMNKNNLKLTLGNKQQLTYLGLGSFCDTQYKVLGITRMSTNITDAHLSSACLIY